MIAVSAGLADAALGSPVGIRSTAGALSLHAEALGDATAHVDRATGELARMTGEAVRALRHRAEDLPPRIDAVAGAYDEVAEILQEYASAVEGNQQRLRLLNDRIVDDAAAAESARNRCLASDTTYAPHGIAADQPPAPYTAPQLDGLGPWHSAADQLNATRASLAAAQADREEIDHRTAGRLRDVDLDGPAIRRWLHELAPAAALGVAGYGAYSKTKGAVDSMRVGRRLTAANAEFRATGNVTAAIEAQFLRRQQLEMVNGVASARSALERTGSVLHGASRLTSRLQSVSRPLAKVGAAVASNSAVRTAGKVLGPVGAGYAVVDGTKHFFNPAYEGPRGGVDRFVGLVGAAGGSAALLTTAGVIGAGVGAPIVMAAGLAVGAWALGNAIYDNWDSITGFAADAWSGMKQFGGTAVEGAAGLGRRGVGAVSNGLGSARNAVESWFS